MKTIRIYEVNYGDVQFYVSTQNQKLKKEDFQVAQPELLQLKETVTQGVYSVSKAQKLLNLKMNSELEIHKAAVLKLKGTLAKLESFVETP